MFVCNERGVDSAKIACPSMIVMYDEMNATNMYVRRGDFFSDVFLVIKPTRSVGYALGNGCWVVALIGRLKGI